MAFDFPSSPTEGQIYSPAGGPKFVYYAPAWRQVTKEQIIQTFAPTAESRNRLINPAMRISQELGDTGGSGSGIYVADQWQIAGVSSSVINGARTTFGPGALLPNAIYMNTTPADTAAAAGEVIRFQQVIEGNKLSDFMLGTATSKAMVIAFTVNTPVAGTYWVALGNSGSTHTWLGSYTIAAGEVSTWVRKQVTIPAGAINAGTWATTNVLGAVLSFTFHCGTTYAGVAGFQTGNKFAGPGQALGLSSTSVYLTNVGLYLDLNSTGLAPPFQMTDEAEDLRACQRYWEKGTLPLTYHSPSTYTGVSTSYGNFPLATPKRAAPAMTGTGLQYYNTADGFINFTASWSPSTTAVVFYSAGLVNWKGWTSNGSWVASARM